MITARIATLEQPRQLVFKSEELDTELLAPDEILGETIVTAISPGTELAAYSGAPALRPGVTYPRLVGYCNVARVLRAGSALTDVSVGDRILTYSSHRSHFRVHRGGVLAVVPPHLRSEDAVGAYLFHLGYNAVLRSDVRLGSAVIVVGLGVLGLGAVAIASLAGAHVVALSDSSDARARAQTMGARGAFARTEIAAAIQALGNRRADVVVNTSNRWDDWRTALESTADQGTIAVLGFPGRQEPSPPLNPLDSAHFYARQLRIIACGQSPEHADPNGFLPFNVPRNIERILGWMADGTLRADHLVSGEFAAVDLETAYQRLLNRSGPEFTYLLRWSA